MTEIQRYIVALSSLLKQFQPYSSLNMPIDQANSVN